MTTDSNWRTERDKLRQTLWSLLGYLPDAFTPTVTMISREATADYVKEQFQFINGLGDVIDGYLLLPHNLNQPAPAILYHHLHGNKYQLGKEELFHDKFSPNLATQLTQAGYMVLCIDAYGFGKRHPTVIGKHTYYDQAGEWALFKQMLWQGRTLWGMILHDDLLALNYLYHRPEVDSNRIAAMGMSMGGSRSTWLAALDDRIRAVIPIAQMTHYRTFMQQGDLNLHGIYYYVPSVLQYGIDMQHIVALTAPRPQLILVGDQDPLSPIDGVQHIQTFASDIYQLYQKPDAFQVNIYDGLGHDFTQSMLDKALRWLAVNL